MRAGGGSLSASLRLSPESQSVSLDAYSHLRDGLGLFGQAEGGLTDRKWFYQITGGLRWVW